MSREIRLLGHQDGLASALVFVRSEIAQITAHPINAHHRRKIEERKRILAPLYHIQGRLEKERNDTVRALDATRPAPQETDLIEVERELIETAAVMLLNPTAPKARFRSNSIFYTRQEIAKKLRDAIKSRSVSEGKS